MTHNAKVLALLSDGKPHSHRELYGLYVIAHSRVSDLRKRGHNIISWREGDSYFYRLLSDSRAAIPSAPAIAEQAAPRGSTESFSPVACSPLEQLSLVG